MQTVLSLDVDYFVYPKVTGPTYSRPLPERHHVRPLSDVSTFLNKRCLLSHDKQVPGRAAIDHDKAFHTLRDWVNDGRLHVPFSLAHIDAHADLGLGDAGYVEILEDVLHRPLHKRSEGLRRLSLGNWLPYAIANRWIHDVQFLTTLDSGRDPELMAIYFTRSDNYSLLQMQPMDEGQYMDAFHNPGKYATLPTQEPAVTWNRMAEDDFQLDAPPDFVFTCLSPEYTPMSADPIFEIIRSLIHEDIPLRQEDLSEHLARLQKQTEE